MAPSATETVVVTEAPTLRLHSTSAATGDYKELLPVSYDKEAEEGRTGFGAAKVRRRRIIRGRRRWRKS